MSLSFKVRILESHATLLDHCSPRYLWIIFISGNGYIPVNRDRIWDSVIRRHNDHSLKQFYEFRNPSYATESMDSRIQIPRDS